MEDAGFLNDLVTITRLGVVTVLLWAGTRVWEVVLKAKQRRDDRNALLRALFAEVDFNTNDLTRFLETAPALTLFEKLFEKDSYIPHVTDARHTDVYRSGIRELHFLEDDLISEFVKFYGGLEKIRTQIEGLHKPSFLEISVAGKVGTIRGLYDTCSACEGTGKSILSRMERKYSDLKLKRRPERMFGHLDGDEGDLKARLAALTSNLDRIRANTHDS